MDFLVFDAIHMYDCNLFFKIIRERVWVPLQLWTQRASLEQVFCEATQPSMDSSRSAWTSNTTD